MITDNELRQIVANSKNYSEALRKCGKIPRGATYQFFKARLIKLQIDTSHFDSPNRAGGLATSRLKPKSTWKDILISGYKERCKTETLRRYFKKYCESIGTKYVCAICSMLPNWQGEALQLQIDHIDEDNTNNHYSNLQWLCPNCHSQKTLKSQQKSKYCLCGKKISRQAIHCPKCAPIYFKRRKGLITWPTKEKLQELVSKKTLTAIAKQFGASATGLGKHIRKLGIKSPGKGYWQKKAAGKLEN